MCFKLFIIMLLTIPLTVKANALKDISTLEMIKVPYGTFIMGMLLEKDDSSLPKHKVFVDAFFIDKYEVTQKAYKKMTGINPSATKEMIEFTEKLKDETFKTTKPIVPIGDDYPVTNVSWYDAAKYCNSRSKKDGLEPCYDEKTWECDFTKNGFRLPTEAEWEYACRAGNNGIFYWGNDGKLIAEYENYWPDCGLYFKKKSEAILNEVEFVWNKPFPIMLPVGHKKPNKWGLYDMLGNAGEWCNDWFDINYYKTSPENNPQGPAKGEEKILRGGSFKSIGWCGYRSHGSPITKSITIGFRCVRNAPKEEKAEEKPVKSENQTENK